jgi:hypothetical protein
VFVSILEFLNSLLRAAPIKWEVTLRIPSLEGILVKSFYISGKMKKNVEHVLRRFLSEKSTRWQYFENMSKTISHLPVLSIDVKTLSMNIGNVNEYLYLSHHSRTLPHH